MRLSPPLNSLAILMLLGTLQTATAQQPPTDTRINMVGSYGPWLAEKALGESPAKMSFRTGKWKSLNEWRKVGQARVLECMAPIDSGGLPQVKLESTHEFDGLTIER